MEQIVTGRFDALNQAEGAATKLKSIRAKDVEISEWNGGGNNQLPEGTNPGIAAFGYGPNMGGGIMGLGGGYTAGGFGFGFIPFMQDDYDQQDSDRGFILYALIQDDQRDKAIRIIREAGGTEL
jgi:hypothetical protein